jgi:uncharacterized HAD superfamily protein/adenine/guanine phosphoribosyltransferase-like PRPP-binding protein
MHYRSISDLNQTVVRNLHKLPRDIELVVGIPRSGLLAANLLSLNANIPMTDLDSYIDGKTFSSGATKSRSMLDRDPSQMRNVLIMDDSISSGNAMMEARNKVAHLSGARRHIFAATYALYKRHKEADLIMEVLPQPRMFEWNFMHHRFLEQSCLDIDGVLCVDPTDDENDDGEAYLTFLAEATPLYMPSRRIAYLVTSRLEKYRPMTEAWLAKQGIAYGELIMLDLPSKEERQRLSAHGSFKAEFYRSCPAILFIESDREQAVRIAALSGKPVLCTETHELFHGDESLLSDTLRQVHALGSRSPMLKATARAMLGERGYHALRRYVTGYVS